MHDVAPYAYSKSGNLIVLADGPELLVYSAANDQGLWKTMAEDILLGVGATEEQVLSLDASGRITAYRPVDGQQLFQVETQTSPLTMEVSPDGHCAILEASALCIVRPGVDPLRLAWETPRQVAWGPDSASLGIGGADGTFAAVDPGSGGAWGSQQLGSPITGVCFRPDGTWAVAHGQQISFVSGDGTEITSVLPVAGAAGEVAISDDGSILAVVVDKQRVQVFELHGNAPVGDITFQRDVSHLRFGPKLWLGFGFDDGDANRLDVATGTITRTQAHPGRAQNAWAMNASVNHALVRGAIANVASSGAAIAAKGAVKADKAVTKKKRNPAVYWTIGIVGALMVFIGCCGGGSIMAWLATVIRM